MQSVLDRKTPPPQFPLKFQSIPQPEEVTLSGGQSVMLVKSGKLQVVQVNFLLHTAIGSDDNIAAVRLATRLLSEGTKSMSASAYADAIDTIGGSIEYESTADGLWVTIQCLDRFLGRALELAASALFEPAYTASDFERVKQQVTQQLAVQEQKNAQLAMLRFRSELFAGHPYEKASTAALVDSLQHHEVLAWYQNKISQAKFTAFVAGANPASAVPLIEQHFGKWSGKTDFKVMPFTMRQTSGTIQVAGPNNLQHSIRMGGLSLNQKHPDYAALRLANTIFGGYFGSRLMSNIREEKGYTYGINSQIVLQQQAAFMVIGTDVKAEASEDTLAQISLEAKRLQSELVDQDELMTVKNYMLGTYLGSINTAFDVVAKVRSLHVNGLDANYLEGYYCKLMDLTAYDVMRAAQQYLNTDNMLTVVAGYPAQPNTPQA